MSTFIDDVRDLLSLYEDSLVDIPTEYETDLLSRLRDALPEAEKRIRWGENAEDLGEHWGYHDDEYNQGRDAGWNDCLAYIKGM